MVRKVVYLSLGSNIGDRLRYLTQATQLLSEHLHICVTKISSVYETSAWGLVDQDDFYNIVLEVETSLLPKELLEVCQKIESDLERTRKIHWGPRTIDIDILLYEGVQLREKFLTIPHKYLLERPFVTIPLAEIAPDECMEGVEISTVAMQHSKLDDKCRKVGVEIVLPNKWR